MVYFVSDTRSINVAAQALSSGYPLLINSVRFVEYSQILSLDSIPSGTYVFTGTVSFDEERRRLACLVESQFRMHPQNFRILNSPTLIGETLSQFHRDFAGTMLSETNVGQLEGCCQVQPVFEPGKRAVAPSAVDNLPELLAELLMDGNLLHEIGIFDGELGSTQVLIYPGVSVNIAGKDVVPPRWLEAYKLDFYSLEFALRDGVPKTVAICDRLESILPFTSPGSPLSKAVTAVIRSSDSVGKSEGVRVTVSVEELSKTLNLS